MFPEKFLRLRFSARESKQIVLHVITNTNMSLKKHLAIWENKMQHCWVPLFEADCYLHFVAPVSTLRV